MLSMVSTKLFLEHLPFNFEHNLNQKWTHLGLVWLNENIILITWFQNKTKGKKILI